MARLIELRTSGQDGLIRTRSTLLPRTPKIKIAKMVEMTVFKILDVNQQRKSPEKWETNRADPATAHLLPCWFSGQNIHRGPPGCGPAGD